MAPLAVQVEELKRTEPELICYGTIPNKATKRSDYFRILKFGAWDAKQSDDQNRAQLALLMQQIQKQRRVTFYRVFDEASAIRLAVARANQKLIRSLTLSLKTIDEHSETTIASVTLGGVSVYIRPRVVIHDYPKILVDYVAATAETADLQMADSPR
jgi:hypothetical protein